MTSLAIQYSSRLIVVSVAISIISAYAAFALADRTHNETTNKLRRWWLAGGSCAMGAGIWSMHYLGMLAMQLPVDVLYFFPTVLLSLMLAICASAVALTIVGSERPTAKLVAMGGVLMGLGIGGMHYVGMTAMRMGAMDHYSLKIVALSVVVAVGFSWCALWIAVGVRDNKRHGEWLRLIAAVVMGLGIASMHYIAMAGMSYTQTAMVPEASRWALQVGTLGIAGVALTTLFILIAALGMAALDKHLFRELHKSHLQLLAVQASLTEANRMLSELSIRDALTGLFNRRHFDSVFETEWRRAMRFRRPLALLMIDVDCFKGLNDTYGHPRGDFCLQEIARTLEKGPRRGYDLIARIGGEEFAVLLPGAEAAGAKGVAEAIAVRVRALQIENEAAPSGHLSISVGVSSHTPGPTDRLQDIMGDADKALYAAKEKGRDRIEVAKARPREFANGQTHLGEERARN